VQVGIYKALLDTASGLDYLHSIGIVHGDLKTANVLLKGSTKDPRGFMCKITDFGLSRVLDLDATHISTATYGEKLSWQYSHPMSLMAALTVY
jgi:serine/threonine protein kinase